MIHVVFSGGLDSTALLTRATRTATPCAVRAVSFDYGQTHRVELEAAARITAHLGVDHRVVDLEGLLTGSALTGQGAIPSGAYEPDGMAATVVNGRNLLFASVVIAQAGPGDEVWLGVHGGDHHVYPDCRPSFVDALEGVAAAYDVTVRAPWLHLDKAEVVAAEPTAPHALSWSCYRGGDAHCGRCGTCVERAEAFTLAGVTDPTTYHSTPKDNS